MSAPPRPFLLRFTLALLGMVLFCVCAFVGFGWVVWKHGDWLLKVMDEEREDRIWCWYGHIAAGLAPWDSDGDGYCGGLELWLETDPRKPTSRPDCQSPLVSWDQWGNPFCGEWSHKGYKPHIESFVFGWVPGTQFLVSAANPAIVFRKRAGDPESSTLNVAANANGELEFEVCFKAPVIRNNPPYPSTGVAFSDPKSGDKFYDELENVYGWRGPTMPVTFCDVFGKPLSVPWNPDANTYIVRPTGWENAAWFLVERRRKGSSEGFHGWPVSPPEKETEIFFSLEWVEEGSQRTDYDWQITSFLKVPAPNSPPPARSPR